jgi:hypothetical protein
MNIGKLMNALDNDDNEKIMNVTTKQMIETNLNILNELQFDKNTTLNYLNKLKGYKYVDEMDDLKYGAFIRWIPITKPENIPLHHCGIICDIKITNNGVLIMCKNFMHRHYTFKMDECLIFQKLTPQEQIIVCALDHLEKEKNDDKKHSKHYKYKNIDYDDADDDVDDDADDDADDDFLEYDDDK